jgi:feruloyl esterase
VASVRKAILAIGFLLIPAMSLARSATCVGLKKLEIPDTQITSAQMVPARDDVPEYCDVFGLVKGSIGFAVKMPTSGWNQKLFFEGSGAFGGYIDELTWPLIYGYATASTDTGHQADLFDASWALDNRNAEIDFGHRAVHLTAVVAKIILNAYYGRGPRLSYFDGCSTGGAEGLREAQLYPDDFNGIISGAPALDYTGLFIAENWNQQALHATPDSSDIPLEKIPVIGNAVVADCDAMDGLVDGLIDDPRRCSFDPNSLRCRSGDAPDCLTGSQVRALKKIYAGPTASSGMRLFPGLSVGGETLNQWGWDTWLINSPGVPSFGFVLQDQFFRYLAFRVDDENFDWSTFDFDADPQRMGLMAHILNATNTDLSAFRDAGGKLLLYHGWSDPIIAPKRTIDYYAEVQHRFGPNQTKRFARLFMAPGMSHCQLGPGPFSFDAVGTLERWVEQGIAPSSIEAAHFDESGNVDRTRPLCPYPRVARYTDVGSIDDAANFRCVEPPDSD